MEEILQDLKEIYPTLDIELCFTTHHIRVYYTFPVYGVKKNSFTIYMPEFNIEKDKDYIRYVICSRINKLWLAVINTEVEKELIEEY